MPIPKFLQSYLASYDLSELDTKEDKKLIITEILNKGNGEALSWVTDTYSKDDIKEVVSSPTRGMWLETNLAYWQMIFGLKIAPEVYRNAVINLNPQ